MSTPTQSDKVLAVDPGFDRIGIAIVEMASGKMNLLFSHCLETDPKDSRHDRLHSIGIEIKKIIKKWKPSSLAIETLFFNNNVTSALGVAEARGIIIYESRAAGLGVFEYSPQAVKIAVTGYGKADKIQISTMIKKLIDLPSQKTKKLDDEMDAIAMGITHLATKRGI